MEKALVAFLLVAHIVVAAGAGSFFESNFQVTWGADHVQPSADGNSVKMFLDKTSGANFAGTKSYVYGGFSAEMQLPGGDSAGVVTAMFTTSQGANHDELDFEFLGNVSGQPYILQTNVFANGVGGREERLYLWFDPTQGFHTYEVVWNPKLITFFVDKIPIRMFRNNVNIGVDYPSQPMAVYSSIFDGSTWATRGGAVPVDYTKAPFVAAYQNFQIQGCQTSAPGGSSLAACSSDTTGWWTQAAYDALDANQITQLRWVRQHYLQYTYCTDTSRYSPAPGECASNNP
jgi:xyloglucan:xyloglucosyl transferase